MAAYEYYEPLRAVPPITSTERRFAYALWFREQARRAYDARPSAPRKAAAYAARLAERLHLTGALAWLRHRTGGSSDRWRPCAGALRDQRRRSPASPRSSRATRAGRPRPASPASPVERRAGSAAPPTAWSTAGYGCSARRAIGPPTPCSTSPSPRRQDRRPRRSRSSTGSPGCPTRRPRRSGCIAGIARSCPVHRALKLLIANPFVRFVVEGLVSARGARTRAPRRVAAVPAAPGRGSAPIASGEQAAETYAPAAARPAKLAQQPCQPAVSSRLTMPTWVPDRPRRTRSCCGPSTGPNAALRERQQSAASKNRPAD